MPILPNLLAKEKYLTFKDIYPMGMLKGTTAHSLDLLNVTSISDRAW